MTAWQDQAAPPLNDPDPMDGWERLDRRTIFVAPLKPLLSVVGVIALITLVRGWEKIDFWQPAITIGVAIALFVGSFWHWSTTRYRITGTHIELHSGMVVRKHRSLARDRVRAVDMSADVFHRLFGLSEVVIGTGRQVAGSDDELKLDAITNETAERLRTVLLHREPVRQKEQTASEVRKPGQLSKFDVRWLRYAPLTFFGFLALVVIVGGGFQLGRIVDFEIWETAPARALFDWYVNEPLLLTVAISAAVVLVLTTLLSVLVYAVFYWGFELTRQDGALRVQYGLITKRSVSIEERRLRGIQLDEPLLLRASGGARVKAVATGLGKKKGDDEKFEVDADLLLPQAPREEVVKVVASVLHTPHPPTETVLRRHPRAAARRLIMWHTIGFAVPAGTLGILSALDLTPGWIWQLLLVLVPIGLVFGIGEYRGLGHGLSGDYLVVRWGVTPRTTVAVQRTGIIGWNIRQTPFQRRAKLITVGATIAAGSGHYKIRYADQTDGLQVADEAIPELLAPFLTRD
jgi:putative membrane protein